MNKPCYYRVSVKALITDDFGNFLLAKESDGTWDLLGGGLDHNEDPVTALGREIHEEIGLVVTGINPSPKYFITVYRSEKDVFIANAVYEVKIKNLQFTPSDECEELRYFSIEEARELTSLPNVKKFLEVYSPEPRGNTIPRASRNTP